MRLLLLTIATLFTCFISSAQEDLTGTWEGAGGGAHYAKLCIIRYNNTYVGFTYDEGMGHCKCHFLGEYDPEKKKLKGVNKGVIEKTFFHSQSRYNLNYQIIGGKEYLKGTVGPKVVIMSIPAPISYTRISSKVDTTDYMLAWLKENVPAQPSADITKQETPIPVETIPPAVTTDTVKPVAIQKPAPIIAAADSILTEKNKRTTDTLSVISTDAKELVIKVMDNGVVDGDTVSVIHNGRVIAERISVKATPYEIKIPIGKGNERQEIVLVAHNLGSIAPNTALIMIETSSEVYRLTASTNLSKNAMIIFQYKE
jgi:hypothetical protein